jgi:hypothetical protein
MDPLFEHPAVQRTLPASQMQIKISLEADTQYYWRVTARNDLGATTSSERSFHTGSLRSR